MWRLLLLIAMLSSIIIGSWLGYTLGLRFIKTYTPPTKPKRLIKVSEEKEAESSTKLEKLGTELSKLSKRFDVPIILLPQDLKDQKSLLLAAKRKSGPLFEMKPPKKKEELEKEKKEKPKPKKQVKKPKKKPKVKPKKKEEEKQKKPQGQEPSPSYERYYLQVGMYSIKDNAIYVRNNLRKLGVRNVSVNLVIKRSLKLYQVSVGPFSSPSEARKVQEVLNANGYSAILYRSR